MPIPRSEVKVAKRNAFSDGVEQGKQEGEDEFRNKVLAWLQAKYIGPDAPPRNSAEGKAILTLAREFAEFSRETLKR